MGFGVWEALRGLFRGGEDPSRESDGDEDATGEPDGNGEEGRFVPSPLDRSVRVGHGGSSDERARELADVNEQARELERERRGD